MNEPQIITIRLDSMPKRAQVRLKLVYTTSPNNWSSSMVCYSANLYLNFFRHMYHNGKYVVAI